MRKKPLLSDEQCSAVHREIAAAERRTSAEILPAVARASGRYDRAEDVVGLWFGLLLCATIWYFFQGVGGSGGWSSILEVRMGFWAVAVAVVLGFIVGVIVGGRVHWLRRLFTSNLEMEQEVLGRRIPSVTQKSHCIFRRYTNTANGECLGILETEETNITQSGDMV